jgi:hypothetical protein
MSGLTETSTALRLHDYNDSNYNNNVSQRKMRRLKTDRYQPVLHSCIGGGT